MTDPTNRGSETVVPNVVPASFTPPAPETFEIPVSQELRNVQSRLAQGYTQSQVTGLEKQLHTAQYKRMDVDQTDEQAEALVKQAKTVRTVMLNDVSEWAGSLSEEEIQSALPSIWNHYAQQVQEQENPAPEPPGVSEEVDETPDSSEEEAALVDPDEMTPVRVINRPDVPADAPKSEVIAPDEISLGDVLGKIAEGDTSD